MVSQREISRYVEIKDKADGPQAAAVVASPSHLDL